jgi:hypothetical protein
LASAECCTSPHAFGKIRRKAQGGVVVAAAAARKVTFVYRLIKSQQVM